MEQREKPSISTNEYTPGLAIRILHLTVKSFQTPDDFFSVDQSNKQTHTNNPYTIAGTSI